MKTKHRLRKMIIAVPLLLVLLGAGILPDFLPLIGTPKAAAFSSNDFNPNSSYIFYSPTGNDYYHELKKELHDNNENGDAIGQTVVYAKGGVFGSGTKSQNATLSYNKDRTGCVQSVSGIGGDCTLTGRFGGTDRTLYVYNIDYTCNSAGSGSLSENSGGDNLNDHYDISFNISVNLDGSGHALFNGDNLNSSVRLHWAGFTKIDHYVKFTPNPNSATARPGPNDTKPKDLPVRCRPPAMPDHIYTGHDFADPNGDTGGNVNVAIPVYQRHPEALKPRWGLAAGSAAIGGGGNGGSDSKQLWCDLNESPLTWIICPVVDLLSGAIETVDSLITQQLDTDTGDIFCNNNPTCKAYHAAWASFRNIALGLLAVAGLVIVISQAMGLEILDAYTVRKALPRVLIVAVGITLSWKLMEFGSTLFNDLTFGIRHLMYAPFSKLSSTIDLSFGGNIASSFFSGLGTTAGAAVAAVPLWVEFGGFGVLITWIMTAALAVMVAIISLDIVQVARIALMIVSPVAMALYIFPNTEKYFKRWWEWLLGLWLIGVIIASTIAAGRIFAAVALANSNNPVDGFIGFITYFVPYFTIPLQASRAPGITGSLFNAVHSKAGGMREALSKTRAEQREQRHKLARKQGLYRKGLGQYRRTFKRDANGKRLNPFRKGADGKRIGWDKTDTKRLAFKRGANGQVLNPFRKGANGKRVGFGRKATSLDRALNTITSNTIDAPDYWRIQAAARGGAVGRALFGRPARGLVEDIRDDTVEASEKVRKKLGLRYHASRITAGRHWHAHEDLKKQDEAEGRTGEDSAAQKWRDEFSMGKKDANGHVSEEAHAAAGYRWKKVETEEDAHKAASILELGGKNSTEAAGQLRRAARHLDEFRHDPETNRADVRFAGMQETAAAGRLYDEDYEQYFHEVAEEHGYAEAQRRIEVLQDLAEPLRTSQKKGYNLQFVPQEDGTVTIKKVYDDPTSEAAQTSAGRMSTQDMIGKSEDLVDPEGDISGAALTNIAMASEYEMERVPLMRVNPKTGQKERVINPRNGEGKWTLARKVVGKTKAPTKVLNLDGTSRIIPAGSPMYERKEDNKARMADQKRSHMDKILVYGQGDAGFGAQVDRMRDMLDLPPVGQMSGTADPHAIGAIVDPPPAKEPPPPN